MFDRNFLLGKGFVVAASILEGDYLDNYRHVEPVRAVRIGLKLDKLLVVRIMSF